MERGIRHDIGIRRSCNIGQSHEPAAPDEIRTALAALNPDDLSPKAALDALYKLRKLMESRK